MSSESGATDETARHQLSCYNIICESLQKKEQIQRISPAISKRDEEQHVPRQTCFECPRVNCSKPLMPHNAPLCGINAVSSWVELCGLRSASRSSFKRMRFHNLDS
mmetsp:Transcript_25334/g.57904  ORF Transcript_25334/g.57904 Transcript_25334/m.57904 type:complete len:106 (-) Transcript_25334:225-542(-)